MRDLRVSARNWVTGDSSWPPHLEAPDSQLGRLQRGLGSAAREVLEGRARNARDLVRSCLEADPRWDTDLDNRADYYAVLGIAAGVDVDVLEALARDPPRGDGSDPGPSPVLGVLARTAARGNTEAISAIRRYIATGRYWEWVIPWLLPEGRPTRASPGWPEWVDGLASVLCERFPTADLMSEAITDAWSVRPTDAPWDVWRAGYPLIEGALEGATEIHERPAAHDRYAEATTSELLALEKATLARRVASVLASRTGDEDVQLMLRAAENPSLAMHGAAVGALATQQHTEVLPAVLRLSEETGRGITRALLYRAFVALPYAATRATAAEWLTGGDRTRRGAAANALGAHAIDDDVRLITAELSGELDQGLSGDQYVVCALAEALGRHPEQGPYPELDRAFSEIPYSFGRGYVADAIAATDPRFPDELAIDCLWDCEPAVRATGAKHVNREKPFVAARLQQIRTDPLEDKEPREAAT